MNLKINHSQQKFIFLLLIVTLYTVVVVQSDFLLGIKVKDEPHFWETSLLFSKRLIPTIDSLRDYKELNTPLPFMIFGALEYFFGRGVFAGRLLNLILSIIIVLIIGYPSRDKGGKAILCLIGLFACPYFLKSSVSLVTDTIAYFFVLLGFMAYVRDRHIFSSIAFILAIASRQYMLAFPVAIATYEFIVAFTKNKNRRGFDFSAHWRWIAPSIAAISILGWFYLFGGLAPSTGIQEMAPEIQKTTWFINPNRAIYFLAFVSIFMVIPEFILFQPLAKIKSLKQQPWRKILLIAVCWLLYCIIFPPPTDSDGMFSIVVKFLHYEILKIALFYALSLLACIRFSQPNLLFFCILFNCIIMMKAHYWSKYVLPLSVVFWYLKSLGLEDRWNILHSSDEEKPNKIANVERANSISGM